MEKSIAKSKLNLPIYWSQSIANQKIIALAKMFASEKSRVGGKWAWMAGS